MHKKTQKRISRPDRILSIKRGSIIMTYDKEADAAYFKVRKGRVARTVELQNWLLADVDKNGVLLGVEMLFMSDRIPKKNIPSVFRAGKIPVAV